jgi:hypothetical protein
MPGLERASRGGKVGASAVDCRIKPGNDGSGALMQKEDD